MAPDAAAARAANAEPEPRWPVAGLPLGLSAQPLTPQAARAVIAWRYEEPYAIYNLSEIHLANLLDPENGYFGLHSPEDGLIGFCCFGRDARVPGGEYDGDAVDAGIGIRPDLTGKGQGRAYVSAVAALACRLYHPAQLRVTIAEFNQRSQKAHLGAGFRVQRRFSSPDGRQWVVMTASGQKVAGGSA